MDLSADEVNWGGEYEKQNNLRFHFNRFCRFFISISELCQKSKFEFL